MGLLAVTLALTGIFGVVSYSVAHRLRELGIRVALGAPARAILKDALGRTAVLLAAGTALGLLLGLAATRLLSRIVYQASAADPIVLLCAAVAMGTVGVLSSFLPARRAMQVEPSLLLRQE